MGKIVDIVTVKAWQEILEESEKTPVLVLKHSTRCPFSADALRAFTAYCTEQDNSVKCCLVKVIENRDVSNTIAQDTGVPHQSPQIHLIKGGASVWNASHHAITKERIKESLNQLLEV